MSTPETERDIGRLEAKVETLEQAVERMTAQLAEISAYMAETKGGWKTLLALAGMASAAASALTWFVTTFVKKMP